MKKRIAYMCLHPDHEKERVARRVFLLPGDPEPPRCPDHPGRAMIPQGNAPYGQGPLRRRQDA